MDEINDINELQDILEDIKWNNILVAYGTKINPPEYMRIVTGPFGEAIFLSSN